MDLRLRPSFARGTFDLQRPLRGILQHFGQGLPVSHDQVRVDLTSSRVAQPLHLGGRTGVFTHRHWRVLAENCCGNLPTNGVLGMPPGHGRDMRAGFDISNSRRCHLSRYYDFQCAGSCNAQQNDTPGRPGHPFLGIISIVAKASWCDWRDRRAKAAVASFRLP